MIFLIILSVFVVVRAEVPKNEAAFKGQFCTDPRTMRKHAAYTEWADAYSCTRHRCQPGGRNLAIYTVGCKRVEAPESAIECEEVVEDTNMQFPFCCTRLRCLVVVRGEVWTRVLGQPWEILPAAPWSHMYKMKKPPPGDGGFLPKIEEGPVYELQTETKESQGEQKVLRSKKASDNPNCNEVIARAASPPAPDIVIALSTGSDLEQSQPTRKKDDSSRYKRGRTQNGFNTNFNFDKPDNLEPVGRSVPDEPEESGTDKEKEPHNVGHQQVTWTEIPQNQWNEHEVSMDSESNARKTSWNDHERENEAEAPHLPPVIADTPEHEHYQQSDFLPSEDKNERKAGNLQALVDAIGTRMRDIESVVAKMSEKVHQGSKLPIQQEAEFGSKEKPTILQFRAADDYQYEDGKDKNHEKMKKPNPDNENYKRFSPRNRSVSKYLHTSGDTTTDQPLFVEDTNLSGYFSDASNSILRRSLPKEPAATYMAQVDARRKSAHTDGSEETEKKWKRRLHKKKKTKGHHKKHHGKDDKRKKFRVDSAELERNAVSLEDISAVNSNAYGNNDTFNLDNAINLS